jgi:hypothetical protein
LNLDPGSFGVRDGVRGGVNISIQYQGLGRSIAETSLCAIALTTCTLFLTASCPSMKITRRFSLVDCSVGV